MQVDSALLRCLSNDSENQFSNWLAYLLGQMKNADILKLFGLTAFLTDTEKNDRPKKVCRESWVASGHENQTGRLDIFVECTPMVHICIETKRGEAQSADTSKQRGYFRSLRRQGITLFCFLLVTHSSEPVVDNFDVILWRDLTLRFRRWVISVLRKRSGPHIYLAFVLGFVAAVERGILGLSLGTDTGVPSVETIAYLTKFVNVENVEEDA